MSEKIKSSKPTNKTLPKLGKTLVLKLIFEGNENGDHGSNGREWERCFDLSMFLIGLYL